MSDDGTMTQDAHRWRRFREAIANEDERFASLMDANQTMDRDDLTPRERAQALDDLIDAYIRETT